MKSPETQRPPSYYNQETFKLLLKDRGKASIIETPTAELHLMDGTVHKVTITNVDKENINVWDYNLNQQTRISYADILDVQ